MMRAPNADGWRAAQPEDKAAMTKELQKLASKAVNRAQIKRTAGMELATAKGCERCSIQLHPSCRPACLPRAAVYIV